MKLEECEVGVVYYAKEGNFVFSVVSKDEGGLSTITESSSSLYIPYSDNLTIELND